MRRNPMTELAGRFSPSRHWYRWVRSPVAARPPTGDGAWCAICRWRGARFGGSEHCEGALCPRCGSIARDRFLVACLAEAQAAKPRAGRLRLLETSPRLGAAYRSAMRRWFDYTCSDFDERAHRGQVRIDLQAIDLPDASFDAVMSSHVLEHVPDTSTALAELHRILTPGGMLHLQVPFLQGVTSTPSAPEFHGDDTEVHWRFGWDLLETMAAAGFDVTPVVPASFPLPGEDPGPISAEFDVASLIDAAPHERLRRLGDLHLERVSGWRPAYMFVTVEAIARG
jgi:SAM-dependent methyltransferase